MSVTIGSVSLGGDELSLDVTILKGTSAIVVSDVSLHRDNISLEVSISSPIIRADFNGIKGNKGDQGFSVVSAEFVGDDIVFTTDEPADIILEDAKIILKGEAAAEIVSAEFISDDMVFTKDDASTFSIVDAKVALKGDKGDTGEKGDQGLQGIQGDAAAEIVSASFVSNDMVFTKDDSTTFAIANAKVDLKGDQGIPGDMMNPMTAANDIIIGGASGTPTRLPVATSTILGRLSGNIDDLTPLEVRGLVGEAYVSNVQLYVANNILDILAASSGAVADASNPIIIMMPDGIRRTRNSAYLSGTSRFTLADGTAYWGTPSGTFPAGIVKLHVYAIWDGTGIVLGLSKHSGFTTVPTTTTATAEDYFLIESSSTYARNAGHACVSIGVVYASYNTALNPDWIFASFGASPYIGPKITWDAKSDYNKMVTLATLITSASDIADSSVVNTTVRQSGWYLITGHSSGDGLGSTVSMNTQIRTGSATYASATLRAFTTSNGSSVGGCCVALAYLAIGDTVHLGVSCTGAGTRRIFGDDAIAGATALSIVRVR